MATRILDIGCGVAKYPGAIGIDYDPNSRADILFDLNCYPWPLRSDAFDHFICNHIVEHISDTVRFMCEIHRLGKIGACVQIVTPHFSNRYSYTDPTHVHHFSLRTFDCFVAPRTVKSNLFTRAFETQHPLPKFYRNPMFQLVSAQLQLARPFRLMGLQRFANRFPDFYELYLAFIFPARDIYVELRVIK
ncbi:MAG: class I SAM-dependent methyltransferase [Anaerolineae bacterium]